MKKNARLRIAEHIQCFVQQNNYRHPERLRMSSDLANEVYGLTGEELGSLSDFEKLSTVGPLYLEQAGLFPGPLNLKVIIDDDLPDGVEMKAE